MAHAGFQTASVSSRPKVSIVTPSFNQGAFLERTICSVLAQNYAGLEYIVMDGGSTDGSLDVIARYASRLAYWSSGHDRGQADALSTGFAKATGSILGWINSDDILLPGALNHVVEYFRVHPQTDVVSGGALQIAEDDTL